MTYRHSRLELVASLVLLAVGLGLALDAVAFAQNVPSGYDLAWDLVQWTPESYVAYYFAAFSASMLALSAAVCPFRGRSLLRARVSPWAAGLTDQALRSLRLHRAVVVFLIVGLAAAFLAVRLVFLPSFQGPDQPLYRTAALRVLTGPRCQPPVGEGACNLQHPPLAKLFMAASMALAGPTATASRLPSLILSTATVPLLGIVAWSLTKNKTVALLAPALLCLDPMFFSWTTLANLDAAEVFFTVAAIAAYLRRPGAVRWTAAAGVLIGLAALSKEVAVLALGGLITYHIVSFEGPGRLKGAAVMLASSFAAFAVGLQAYDSVFTGFPNIIAHVLYMISFLSSETFPWSNPLYWLVSITGEYWGTYYIPNIFASTLALVWLPIGVWMARKRGRGAKALVLASLWLLWTYLPFEPIYLTGRVEYLYYTVQMVPALALGGAYVLASSRFPRPLALLLIGCSVAWFVLFFPLNQSYLPQAFLP